MAKKKKTAKPADDLLLKALPQNILLVGEHGEEEKNIYISQKTYKEIHRFSENKTENECGGMLIGTVIEEFGKTNIVIHGFIEAKHSEGTPTTLKFTHETWEYVHAELAAKYPEMKIVGWIHTHPNFGIFLSEYDKFIQNNFFNDENQIAFVVDPIQKTEGFYFWKNGQIERSKGFYLFDKTGVKIEIDAGNDKGSAPEKGGKPSFLYPALIGVLGACVVFLLCFCLSLNSRLNTLQKQQAALTDSANQSLSYMQQQIQNLYLNIVAAQNGESESETAEETTAEAEESETAGETAEETPSGEAPAAEEQTPDE